MLHFKSNEQSENKGRRRTRPNVCWWDVLRVANGTEAPLSNRRPNKRGWTSSFIHSTSTVHHDSLHSNVKYKERKALEKNARKNAVWTYQVQVACGR